MIRKFLDVVYVYMYVLASDLRSVLIAEISLVDCVWDIANMQLFAHLKNVEAKPNVF